MITANRSMPPGTVIPELGYGDVRAAADWLCKAVGYQARLRIGDHRSQLVFGDGSVIVVASSGRQDPTTSAAAPPDKAGSQVAHGVMVRVADVDGHYERAKAAGARILSPPETYPYGERQYTAEDPGGHRWTFSQSVADVAPEEWGGQLVTTG